MARLDGHVAIITGAATGMGAATATRFVEEGARVLIADLKVDEGQELALSLGENARFLRTDVTKESDIEAMFELALSAWGQIDCIYNNAGFGGALGPIEETTEDDYEITMDVLVKSVFFGTKHAAKHMKKRGGSIINTASIAGLHGGWGPHIYSVAKAAVVQLTKTTALELGPFGIRVNAICPGIIATPLAMGRGNRERFDAVMAEDQPLKRVGEGSDIANLALFLASDESSFMTGETHVIDGGATVGRRWDQQPKFQTVYRPITVYRPPGR